MSWLTKAMQTERVKELNRSHTTISRELKRCKTRFAYSPSREHIHVVRLTLPDRKKAHYRY